MKKSLKLMGMLIILFLSACEENDALPKVPLSDFYIYEELDSMPPYTEQGNEVVAFRIDNKVVLNRNDFGPKVGINRFYIYDTINYKWLFYLESMSNKKSGFQSIVISLENVSDTGLYIVYDKGPGYRDQMQYIAGDNSTFNRAFVTTTEHTGYVHIKKIDHEKRIIAGTFEFKAKLFNYFWEETMTVSVSDGFFDIRF
jgi:hypothetical protein